MFEEVLLREPQRQLIVQRFQELRNVLYHSYERLVLRQSAERSSRFHRAIRKSTSRQWVNVYEEPMAMGYHQSLLQENYIDNLGQAPREMSTMKKSVKI